MRAPRDEFTARQKRTALEANASEVLSRWRSEFLHKPAHYMCEECRFVSTDRSQFEVDHVLPCASGGTRDRPDPSPGGMSDEKQLAALYRAGVNRRVLCRGCNQGKKAQQFIPPGAGYAYRRPEDDLNPDHLFHGRPVVGRKAREEHPAPYNPRRYGQE